MHNDLVQRITDFYLHSGDFNGLPIRDLAEASMADTELRRVLADLVEAGKISLNFGDQHPNPHIKALPADEEKKQVEKLFAKDLTHVCAYPTSSHLSTVVDAANLKDRPFTLRLTLGEPQLSYFAFDLSVLEYYRNDPRYYYRNNDISGMISIRSDLASQTEMPESDQVLMQTFGFAYDDNLNRAVAVFLRYLHCLSPEHQRIWNTKLLLGSYKLHPDYFRSSMLGDFPEGISIFEAFLAELDVINEICKLMSRPKLFLKVPKGPDRPKGFGFLIRPTLKEFNDFVHLLDKLIADNINREFFQNEVAHEIEEVRRDGKIVVNKKNTIHILQDWLTEFFRTEQQSEVDEMLSTFKYVRKLRQKPAHSINEDEFDLKYIKHQRELMVKAYRAVQTLRHILGFHPLAKGYQLPRYLESARIWTY